MNLEKGSVYKTCMKSYLRFDSKTDMLYNFTLVNKKGVPKKEERNKHGVVTKRIKRSYTLETVESFTKVNLKNNE